MTLSAPLALEQGRLAVLKMADMVDKMLEWTTTYVCGPESEKLRSKILKYEDITDKIHQEVMIFV